MKWKLAVLVVVSLVFGVVSSAAAGEEQSADDERLIEETPADTDEAVDLYTRNFVWAEDHRYIGVNQYGNQVSSYSYTETQFFYGRHKKKLDHDEFYDVVGRPDLASSYRRTDRLESTLRWGGVIGFITGGLLFTAGMESDAGPLMVGSVGLMTVSAISLFSSLFFEPHPIEPHERRELAEEYNLRLLEELELKRNEVPGEQLPDEMDDGFRVDNLQLDLWVGDGADDGAAVGGLVVGGEF